MAINYDDVNGLTKIVYDSGPEPYTQLVPHTDLLSKDFPFETKGETGKSFNYPVQVSAAGGFTYGGQESDVLTLANAISPKIKQAEVKPYLYGFKQQMGYALFDSLGKIKNGKAKEKAFLTGTQTFMETGKESASFQREHGLLFGQCLLGIGVITGTVVSGSGTGTQVWAISDATWNPSILYKALNMRLDIYDTTGATKRNANNTVTLNSIDETNKRVTLEGTAAELDTIVATDALHIEGSILNNMYGLHQALSLTTGTYMGLSATTYPVWKSNQYAFGSQRLSVDRLGNMVNKVTARGQVGELTLYAHRQGVTDLQNSLSGQILLNNNPSSFDNDIMTITVASRKIKVKVHDYAFPGYCYLVPSKGCCVRVGPTDLSFKNPANDMYFEGIPGSLGVEMKFWGDQTLLVRRPAHCCLGTGITNSTD
jgi:hypothetical protein